MSESHKNPKSCVVEKLKSMSDDQIIPILVFLAGMDAGEKFAKQELQGA